MIFLWQNGAFQIFHVTLYQMAPICSMENPTFWAVNTDEQSPARRNLREHENERIENSYKVPWKHNFNLKNIKRKQMPTIWTLDT